MTNFYWHFNKNLVTNTFLLVVHIYNIVPEVQQINVIPHYAGRVNDLQNAEVLIMMSVSFSPETVSLANM